MDYWLTPHARAGRVSTNRCTPPQRWASRTSSRSVRIPCCSGMGAECLPALGLAWLPSLRRDRADWSDLLESLQHLYVAGADVDWNGFDGATRGIGSNCRRILSANDGIGRISLTRLRCRRRPESDGGASMSASTGRRSRARWISIRRRTRRKWECLARLTEAHAIRSLREAGLFSHAGERRTLDDLLEEAQIASLYRHLVLRGSTRLAADGLLTSTDRSSLHARRCREPDLLALWAEAERLFVDNEPLLAYVRHCGGLVGKVLTGERKPARNVVPAAVRGISPKGLYRAIHDHALRQRPGSGRSARSLAASTPAGRIASRAGGRRRHRRDDERAASGATAGPDALPVHRCLGAVPRPGAKTIRRVPFVEYGRLDMDRIRRSRATSPAASTSSLRPMRCTPARICGRAPAHAGPAGAGRTSRAGRVDRRIWPGST